jgi:hypothetical protein
VFALIYRAISSRSHQAGRCSGTTAASDTTYDIRISHSVLYVGLVAICHARDTAIYDINMYSIATAAGLLSTIEIISKL